MTNRRGSAPELQAWAALVAAFYERNGRDPTEFGDRPPSRDGAPDGDRRCLGSALSEN